MIVFSYIYNVTDLEDKNHIILRSVEGIRCESANISWSEAKKQFINHGYLS